MYLDTCIIYYTIPFWNLTAAPGFSAGISHCWILCSMLLAAAGGVCWPRCGDVAPEVTGGIGWAVWDADACAFLPVAFLTEPFFMATNAGYHMAIPARTETITSLCRKLNLKGLHDNKEAAKNHISSGCQLPVFLALRRILPWYSHPSTAQPQGVMEQLCVCSSSSSCPAHKLCRVWRCSQLRLTELAGTEALDCIPTIPKAWNHCTKNKCKQKKVTVKKKLRCV